MHQDVELPREAQHRGDAPGEGFGVFPSKGSLIRLVGTYLIEENDRWAAKSKQYWLPVVEEL